MNTLPAPAAPPLLSPRERRVLLWLSVAAVCWRWLLAIRAPLPGLDAATDLWVAQRLAHGDFAALGAVWWRPLWPLLLAPALAWGAAPFAAAQVAACTLGGLALWPVAVAAQRLREGAGVPAAVCLLAAAVDSAGAAAGAALPLATCFVALAAAEWTGGRPWRALVLAAVAAATCGERLAPAAPVAGALAAAAAGWRALRAAWSAPGALACLSVLPPRPRRQPVLQLAAGLALALAAALLFATGAQDRFLPLAAAPVVVLAGVGLARLPGWSRELLLAGVVVLGFHTGWHLAEPRDVVVERLLGEHLLGRCAPGDTVVSDLPRVLWAARTRPTPPATADALLAAAARPDVAFVVLGGPFAGSATVRSALAGRFRRYEVPNSFRDLVVDRGLAVFSRRE